MEDKFGDPDYDYEAIIDTDRITFIKECKNQYLMERGDGKTRFDYLILSYLTKADTIEVLYLLGTLNSHNL